MIIGKAIRDRLFEGYLPCTKEKRPMISYDDLKSYSEVEKLKHFSGRIRDDIVLVDVDDLDDGQRKTSEIILKIVKDLNLKTVVLQSPNRGYHFYFINDGSIDKNRNGNKIALTLESIAYKTGYGGKKAHGMLRLQGKDYELIFDGTENGTYPLDTIPIWLKPIKTKKSFKNLKEGSRNDALFNYAIDLKKGFLECDYKESIEIRKLINDYVFLKPLTDKEFKTCTRLEAWEDIKEKPKWVMTKDGREDSLNDIIFADEFIREKNIIYCRGVFYNYDGKINSDKMKSLIQEKLEPQFQRSIANKVNQALEAIRNKAYKEEEKPHKNKIHVANGTIVFDFDNGNFFFQADKEHTFNRLNIVYNPQAVKPEKYLNSLERLFNQKQIDIFQEFMGYCLLPIKNGQKSMFIYGQAGTGKSTLITNVIQQVLGEKSFTKGSLKQITGAEDKYSLSKTNDTLVFIDDDSTKGEIQDLGKFKRMITDTILTTEQKYKDAEDVYNYCRFLFIGNQLPVFRNIKDIEDGFFRRVLILKTNYKSVKEVDTRFNEKLEKEIEGIFNWWLEGLERLINNNFQFSHPDYRQEVIDEYRGEETFLIEPILTFIKDKNVFEYGLGFEVSTEDLYKVYLTWYAEQCEHRGIHPKTCLKTVFERTVAKNINDGLVEGVRKGRVYQQSKNGYLGIRFKQDSYRWLHSGKKIARIG